MPYIDELSILADAVDFGKTHAQCDINKIAEQGAVPCRELDVPSSRCVRRFLRFLRIVGVHSLSVHCSNDWSSRMWELFNDAFVSIDWDCD